MHWDLGLEGLALLGVISLGFGAFAGLVAGGGPARRLVTAAVTTASCFGVGLLVSEGLFGWATEEELQPNIDGLSRDEVLLSSFVTTALVLLALGYVVRRHAPREPDRRSPGRHHGRHVRHA